MSIWFSLYTLLCMCPKLSILTFCYALSNSEILKGVIVLKSYEVLSLSWHTIHVAVIPPNFQMAWDSSSKRSPHFVSPKTG